MADLKCQPVEVWYLHQLTITVLFVSCVAGVLGKGLVLWMAVFRMACAVTMVWFFSLALADFTVLLSVPVSLYIIVHGWWPSANLVCKLYMAFLVLTVLVHQHLFAGPHLCGSLHLGPVPRVGQKPQNGAESHTAVHRSVAAGSCCLFSILEAPNYWETTRL